MPTRDAHSAGDTRAGRCREKLAIRMPLPRRLTFLSPQHPSGGCLHPGGLLDPQPVGLITTAPGPGSLGSGGLLDPLPMGAHHHNSGAQFPCGLGASWTLCLWGLITTAPGPSSPGVWGLLDPPPMRARHHSSGILLPWGVGASWTPRLWGSSPQLRGPVPLGS